MGLRWGAGDAGLGGWFVVDDRGLGGFWVAGVLFLFWEGTESRFVDVVGL